MWPRLAAATVTAAVALMTGANASDARFLALGDSYTIGEGVAVAQRWPDQLAAALRSRGTAVADPDVVARTGWTTDELSAAMDGHAFAAPYALVTLQIGVNNQYRGRDAGNFTIEFTRLLKRAITLAGQQPRHVIVVSIPDWSATRFGRESGRDAGDTARQIDAYDAVCKTVAKALNTRFVDVTAVSRAAGDATDMLGGDGLHPSAAMYARWVGLILPEAQAVLAKR